MRPLQPLIGTWITEVELTARGEPTGERSTFVDTYEWLPGGHFIAHKVNGEMKQDPLQGLEIIGYDGRVLRATSYDSAGKVTHYQPKLVRHSWSMLGDLEKFKGNFSRDWKRLEGSWERRNSRGQWHETMRVVLTRIGE